VTPAPRTVAAINRRVADGGAVVWTAADLAERRRANVAVDDVDIVTVAFASSLSGTAAMLCVPVAGRGVFTRAETIWLNGVRGHPGPAPNERLGVVDTMIMADEEGDEGGAGYDGAALLLDLLKGKEIAVECLAVEGSRHAATVTLSELEFARLYVYNAFLADTPAAPPTTPILAALGRGSRVLLNGAQGLIIGGGSRDSGAARALSLAADMKTMDPALMSGLDISDRYGTGHMIGVAVPVLDGDVLDGLIQWSTAAPGAGDGSRQAAARQVRDMILGGSFSLTDTDAPI
jgi:uncharacterized protein (DUF39 family)